MLSFVIAMLVNMGLNIALIFPLQHAGLALATSLSAYLNAFLLLRGLRGDHAEVGDRGGLALAGRRRGHQDDPARLVQARELDVGAEGTVGLDDGRAWVAHRDQLVRVVVSLDA